MQAHRPAGSTPDPIEVMAIGDAGTDVFLRLLQAEVLEGVDGGCRRLVLPFGGKVPFEPAETVPAGGNAANAAVCSARLGCATALLSVVGDDDVGRSLRSSLAAVGVDIRFVQVEEGLPTNRNFVLWHGEDRTILVHHQPYTYRALPPGGRDAPRWCYLSSVGEHALAYHDELAGYLEAQGGVQLAFSPGTFQLALGAARLSRLYRRTQVLCCNREEAARISGVASRKVAELVAALHALGPAIVIVTDGPAGAYASDGKRLLFSPALADPVPPLDRTGAGDAFSATCVAALARGRDLADALALGAINAASVVHSLGSQAGLLDAKELERRFELGLAEPARPLDP
ncbi:MAG: carbohydrate kinase family protein [Actinomycetota bacterium]|nr:carbohydrate kinase family protein [Actinomycetota bacterium]